MDGRLMIPSRSYIICIDEDISAADLKEKIEDIDILEPMDVVFEYNQKVHGPKTYGTHCFVIL